MTQITIATDINSGGWIATFRGGDMPQGIPLPLPFTVRAPVGMVASDLLKRFPGSEIRAPQISAIYRRPAQ